MPYCFIRAVRRALEPSMYSALPMAFILAPWSITTCRASAAIFAFAAAAALAASSSAFFFASASAFFLAFSSSAAFLAASAASSAKAAAGASATAPATLNELLRKSARPVQDAALDGPTDGVNADAPAIMARRRTTRVNMVYVCMSVSSDPLEWHRQNMTARRSDYSAVASLGAERVAKLQAGSAGVWYNTLVPMSGSEQEGRLMKYGVSEV
mmetsp:Transcript_48403/g.135790  ORF Transcript_48403/g.135790 Transcript_48403/m.135790 type:complete len:212 (-) Transcript_48403:129-764(-)